jgi:PKD repeat protein
MRVVAQQPRRIKVSELNVSNIATLEERVFLIHAIVDKGYYCYKNADKPNTIDIYVPNDASDELSDFDFFYDNIAYDQLNDFLYLDKNQRGELFVQWRRELDTEVYQTLFDDFTKGVRADNANCDSAEPFCTGTGLYDFPAGVNSGSPCGTVYNASCNEPYYCPHSTYSHPGQDNCLSTAPNPAFYFLRIDQSGTLNIEMYSTPAVDIDFDCWGPFSDMNTACSQLSCYNIVDCSYSTAATETCHIPNAQSGQYYVLLITNFSNSTCNISFQATGSSTATTDCTLLPPLVENGGPYCVGETIQLTANTTVNASYSWTGPNGYTSNEQNPTIANCTMAMAGLYKCTITYGSQSNFANTQVIVYPSVTANFTYTTACQGTAMQFTSTSTTNPSGQTIQTYQWNFGDGQTGTGQSISHTYASTGTYNVTLYVSTGGHCDDQITQVIQVNARPTASFTATTACLGSATQFTSTSTGQNINSYQWNFGDGSTGTGQSPSHTYLQAGTYQVTLTVQNSNGCSDQVSQSIQVIPPLNVQINVDGSTTICDGDTVTLTADVDSVTFIAPGDILCTDNTIVKPGAIAGKTPKGVVFYVDNTGLHGWAVALNQSSSLKWSTGSNLVGSARNSWRYAIRDLNGMANTTAIQTAGSSTTYPAAWNPNIAQGWYLPAIGQLNVLFGELVVVNSSLSRVGGTQIIDSASGTGTYGNLYLWSSTEKSTTHAYALEILDGQIGAISKTVTTSGKNFVVRAIIDF